MITLQFLLMALVAIVVPGTGLVYTLTPALGGGWRAVPRAVIPERSAIELA
ncbi:hypothetical protein AB2B41_02285 [Marimonas sp. MJW-29]|uniref:Uncharacterized protein n=1 Tax=Sulfitobacter sediminis TaxID=3234186 RepID=A0ABV3RHH2_9RHOB